jgi:aminopeptidase N
MRSVIWAGVVFLAVVSVEAAEKPFDFASTPGKLPKDVLPQQYAVRIAPDLQKLTFSGSETVKLDVRQPVRKLICNVLDMQISAASLDGKALPKAALKIDAKQETLTLELPNELPPGAHELTLDFSGKINQQGQGLYYARYQEHRTGAKKLMLGTQFEATDARRMFPCWDEPSFRSQFQLTAVVPENWTAISNMPVENETKAAGGKEVRFAMTPPMSSYLNVFVAGELDVIDAKSGETQIRVVTTKGKGEMGRYALESTAKILEYYNEYFGVPYPLPKLDQIAVPGGFGGAMENWGGITYYESVLLFDPQNSSAKTKQDIFEVLAHEMAHQWFGDLVTMAWWDNLWLNEGFASWMGSKCTTQLNPDWEVWLQRSTPRDPTRRVGIAKETAMEGDARSTTHPIQQPIANEAEAGGAFDDITYKKGQSFIRLLESFLGPEVFRDGIRKYVAAHKYSNSTTADLWASLAEASGKPVSEIAAGWTEQPGFPIVNVTRAADEISLSQEHFTVHYDNAPAAEWKIPLTYAFPGEPDSVSLLMSAKTAEVPNVAADRAVKLNVQGAGNYRVGYDDKSWELLMENIGKLDAADRVNLLSDAWANVQAKRADMSRYLGLVDKLNGDNALAVREQIIGVFDFINRLIADQPERTRFQQYARSVLHPSFDAVGWQPKPGEPPSTGSLRVSLITGLGDLGDEEIIAGARERFQKYVTNPASLHPDLRPPVLMVVGRYADEPTWNKLHELGLRTTSVEEKQNYYDALAQTTDPKLAQRTLQIALGDELPTSRAVHLVGKVARNSEHPEMAWDFAKKNMKALLAKGDALGVNSYASGLFTFFSEPGRMDELQKYAKANLPPASAKSVAAAIDEVGFRADFKARLVPQLTGWVNNEKRNP